MADAWPKQPRMTSIATPCVNVCQLDVRGETCLGCGRTLPEIAGWAAMTDDERAAVLERLAREKRASPQA